MITTTTLARSESETRAGSGKCTITTAPDGSMKPAGHARLSGPIELSVCANFLNVMNVETVAQCFDAILVLRCETIGLAALVMEHDGKKVSGGDEWEPRISVLNLHNTKIWRMRWKLLKSGELSFKYHIEGTFGEEFELKMFPFDKQELSVHLSSARPMYTRKEGVEIGVLKLVKHPSIKSVVQTENFSNSNVFHISKKVTVEEKETSAKHSTTQTVRPQLTIQLHIQRKAGYFFWNVVLPMLLINLLSLGAFGIPRDEVDGRLTVSLTMVLTAVAFKLQISTDLPNVSYLTLIDWFVLVSFFFISCVAFENMLANDYLSEETDRIFKFFFVAWIGSMTLISGSFFVVMIFLLPELDSNGRKEPSPCILSEVVIDKKLDMVKASDDLLKDDLRRTLLS